MWAFILTFVVGTRSLDSFFMILICQGQRPARSSSKSTNQQQTSGMVSSFQKLTENFDDQKGHTSLQPVASSEVEWK